MNLAAKIDFKKSEKSFYFSKANEVVEVDVPEMQFLMIDGMGSPGETQEYLDAMAALYPVAYKLKFMSKQDGQDYVVLPSEGLWWADDMNDFTEGNRDNWKWIMMIRQPDWITEKMFKDSVEEVGKKKPELKESLKKLRLEKYKEGKSAQIMHIGSYKDEGPNIEKLHKHIQKLGGKFDGHKLKHHEIYLSDPRKTKPESLKTIIRQPFAKK